VTVTLIAVIFANSGCGNLNIAPTGSMVVKTTVSSCTFSGSVVHPTNCGNFMGNSGYADYSPTTKISAYLTADEPVAKGTTRQLTFNATNFDVLTEFDTGTYNFTASQDGYYQISSNIVFLAYANDKNYMVKTYINNVETQRIACGGYVSTVHPAQITGIHTYYLSQGDIVSFWFYNEGSTSDTVVYGSNLYSSIEIVRVN
jgi:hypothetical protein